MVYLDVSSYIMPNPPCEKLGCPALVSCRHGGMIGGLIQAATDHVRFDFGWRDLDGVPVGR